MARSPRLEDRLARLQALSEGEPDASGLADELEHALGLKTNLVVAKAAELVGRFELETLGQTLVEAFGRFMALPADKDAGCVAKTACAKALTNLPAHRFEAREAVFVPGLRHVQREPVWGSTVDTAGELRGTCVYGLALAGDPRSLNFAADLLADPEPAARQGAVHAAGLSGAAAAPLLRLAIRHGEDHPDVLHALLSAVIDLDPDDGPDLVLTMLDQGERGDTAALVLGGSRHDRAFVALTESLNRNLDPSSRAVRITAIAMLRHPPSRRFLFELIREGTEEDAERVIQALSYYQHEEGLLDHVRDAAAGRGLDDHIAQAFRA